MGWLAKMSPPHLLSAPIDHCSSSLQRGALLSPMVWCLAGLYHLGWQPGCVVSEKYKPETGIIYKEDSGV